MSVMISICLIKAIFKSKSGNVREVNLVENLAEHELLLFFHFHAKNVSFFLSANNPNPNTPPLCSIDHPKHNLCKFRLWRPPIFPDRLLSLRNNLPLFKNAFTAAVHLQKRLVITVFIF